MVAVRDLGTRFVIRDRGGAIRVSLSEGRVALTDKTTGRSLAELSAGQEAEIGGSEASPKVTVTSVLPPLSSGSDRMLLREIPLARVLEAMAWRSGVDVSITDERAGNIKVSGVYRAADIPRFLAALAEVEPIRWRQVGENAFEIGSLDP